MKLVQLDSLVIQDFTDSTVTTALKRPIEGLDYPDIRLSSHVRSGDDGIYVTNSYFGERRISIEGIIYKISSTADYEAKRKTLIQGLTRTKNNNGTLTKKVLRFTTEDNEEFRVLVEVVKVRVNRTHATVAEFFIDLIAHTPFIEAYGATEETVTLYEGGGAVVPFILPIALEAGEGGQISATNNGLAPAWPIIVLNGPLTNPRIDNITTGRWLALTLSMVAGDIVTIDTYNKTIVQGGSTNRIDKLSGDSKWWWLEPGANTLRLTSTVSGEAGSASVTFRDAWWGI